MSEKKRVSDAVIKRLPRYYRHLSELIDSNIERISSNELANRMRITASQVRQDLNNFGGFGQQGYGYNVRLLRDEIGTILGLGNEQKCVLIGGGNLGHAIANYGNFAKRGFTIKAIFDVNPKIIGTKINDIKVYDIKELDSFIKKNKINIAIFALPAVAVKELIDDVINAGVEGIWNFSHLDIEVPKNVALVNVHLSDSLMTLAYKINEKRKRKEKAMDKTKKSKNKGMEK